MDPARPNPGDLLARANAEKAAAARGRLKIFFGASPGVGKTYAMLEAARARERAGEDVVVGVVETHKRSETEALLQGLQLLPRRHAAHRGITIDEFDLDAALARKPGLLLVDELAHTNAPNSRHLKRWQDVVELIDSGVDVYTTLNVQHVESLNDVVAQITGVRVRETVPDSIIEQADEIELIDLPVNDLLQRMTEGKVYLPQQAERAKGGFFRSGNLIALRELALRRTADRVDSQMLHYRKGHAIEQTWPVKDRIMAAVGPSPNSSRVIRAASRAAQRIGAEWIAAFVELPEYSRYAPEVRDRILSTMRLAEELGAETVTLTGAEAGPALLAYGRTRNVSRLIAGKSVRPSWKKFLSPSLVEYLIANSGQMEIHLLPPPAVADMKARTPSSPPPRSEWMFLGAVILVCTIASALMRDVLAATNLVMLYLLGVVAISQRCSRHVAFVAAFASVAAFDFFCVPPYYSFAVSDSEYVITFAVMLTVALVIADLTARLRGQVTQVAARESRTQLLYRFSKLLSTDSRAFDLASNAARLLRESFQASVCIFLPDESNRVSFRLRTSTRLFVPTSEEAIAQWVFDHNRKAGRGLDTLNGATAVYFPLSGVDKALGVLAMMPNEGAEPLAVEQHNLIDTLCRQIGLALEHTAASNAVREGEIAIETERLRNSLLSAVSHDLRTPLASITGAASALADQSDRIDPATRRDLLQGIVEEAERLSKLVNNLLEMTRLEAGGVHLNLEWHPLEEIAGAALHRFRNALADRSVRVALPAGLPLVRADAVLLEQVFVNLIENAIRYTPSGSPLEIGAAERGGFVEIEVADRGPGFPPGEEKQVFDKFYRGAAKPGRGAGLGLTICRAIINAHGGSIEAANRPDGGGLVRMRLPAPEQPETRIHE